MRTTLSGEADFPIGGTSCSDSEGSQRCSANARENFHRYARKSFSERAREVHQKSIEGRYWTRGVATQRGLNDARQVGDWRR